MPIGEPGGRHQPRLNPFAFPSDTSFSFVLLIVSIVGASLFIYNAVFFSFPGNYELYTGTVAHCAESSFASALVFPTRVEGFLDQSTTAALETLGQCTASAEGLSAGWTIAGMGILLAVAGVIYWLLPAWKIRRDKLIVLSAEDAPEVATYLAHLCRSVGFTHPPTFVWNPLNRATSGVAFGRAGRRYVALQGGLVTRFYTDLPAFRAVVLHELAHLRNADVDKTYFAVAIWRAFVVAALIPFAAILLMNPAGYVLSQSWRVLAMTLLVFVIRSAVLRTREVYADLRASAWDGADSALRRVLQALPATVKPRRPALFKVHPSPAERRQALDDTSRLFHMSFWMACGTGIVTAVAVPNFLTFLAAFLSAIHAFTVLPAFVAALIFAPLMVGVVVLGVWRSAFAALARDQSVHNIGRLGAGLGLGLVLGLGLALNGDIEYFDRQLWLSPSQLAAFDFTWTVLLVVSLIFFVRWALAGARAWLGVAASYRSPRSVYIVGLIIASLSLAIWLGVLFTVRRVGPFSIALLIPPDPVLALPALAVTLVQTLVAVLYTPAALLLLASLWAFPLTAWFWRKRMSPLNAAAWAFLDKTPRPTPMRQPILFHPGKALKFGLIGGAAYWALLLIVRIVFLTALSETVRSTNDYRLNFFYGQVAVAALLQAIVALVVAAKVRPLGVVHGLFAAFVAGCVMTAGILGLNLLFGGTISPVFVWTVFSQVVNVGAVLALPFALIASALAGRVRGTRPVSVPVMSAESIGSD